MVIVFASRRLWTEKAWSAAAEPAQYGRTGKLSFFMDAVGVRSADVGGKALPKPKN